MQVWWCLCSCNRSVTYIRITIYWKNLWCLFAIWFGNQGGICVWGLHVSYLQSLPKNTGIDNLNLYGNSLVCSVNYSASLHCYRRNRLLTFFCFEHFVFVLNMCNKENFLEYKKLEWEPYVYFRIDGVWRGVVCSIWRFYICKFCGFHNGVNEDSNLLGCDAVTGWVVYDISKEHRELPTQWCSTPFQYTRILRFMCVSIQLHTQFSDVILNYAVYSCIFTTWLQEVSAS